MRSAPAARYGSRSPSSARQVRKLLANWSRWGESASKLEIAGSKGRACRSRAVAHSLIARSASGMSAGVPDAIVRNVPAADSSASAARPTSMTAVIGGDRDEVLAAIESAGLTPANNNGSGQIVAAGTVEQLAALADKFLVLVKQLAIKEEEARDPLRHECRHQLGERQRRENVPVAFQIDVLFEVGVSGRVARTVPSLALTTELVNRLPFVGRGADGQSN